MINFHADKQSNNYQPDALRYFFVHINGVKKLLTVKTN